jgi:hypothetical protein
MGVIYRYEVARPDRTMIVHLSISAADDKVSVFGVSPKP